MSVEIRERSLSIVDNQLGGRIVIFISPMVRDWVIYRQDINGRFIERVAWFSTCAVYSMNYCDNQYDGRNIMIDALQCERVLDIDLKRLVAIPPDLWYLYAVRDMKSYYEMVRGLVRRLGEVLEKEIDASFKRLEGKFLSIVINYFNPELADYSSYVGGWITANPMYEPNRVYGEYCHSCTRPKCRDIETIMLEAIAS